MENCSHKYRIVIQWNEETLDFRALAPELGDCVVRGKTQFEAVALVNDAIERHLASLEQQGLPIPPPLLEKKFSGKIALRIDPALHRDIAIQAAMTGIPITHFIETKLRGK